MENYLKDIVKDFNVQLEKVQHEVFHLEDQLNKKKEHLLKLQGGLETLSIFEQKVSASINIHD